MTMIGLQYPMTETTRMYFDLLNVFTPEDVASRLGLHKNTVHRWSEMKFVPEKYTNDFLRLNMRTDCQPEDQFYTKESVAKECIRKFKAVAKDLGVNLRGFTFIEPSAGCGKFFGELPKNRRIGIDLCPLPPYDNEIEKCDYLSWNPRFNLQYIVIGNPPFGLRGHLALQFMNHSAEFADMIAFILPQLFESDGKGAPMKRVDGRMKLAYSEKLDANSFEFPDGSPVQVSTVFQVWTKINQDRIALQPPKTCNNWIRVYSLSDGGTPSSTRNKKMLNACHVYLPSTCYSGMRAYKSFEDLPQRRGYGVYIHKNVRRIRNLLMNHDWESTAFQSTNGALNLRSSLIQAALIKEGYQDETV